ncbi:hypothetical protein GF360_04180 [candidate division WWE3 bacterium]|nr:hypothetical protein [candidate division WWE3 bacterium]
MSFNSQDINLMQRACLLCDNSSLDVRTGCVFVSSEGVVIGEGHNKIAKGGHALSRDISEQSDVVEQESGMPPIIHAEIAALNQAKQKGVSIKGATVYVTRFPCMDCAKKLVGEGVVQIFYMSDHFTSGNEAMPVFKEAGVSVTQIPEDVVWGRA